MYKFFNNYQIQQKILRLNGKKNIASNVTIYIYAHIHTLVSDTITVTNEYCEANVNKYLFTIEFGLIVHGESL